MRLPEKTASYIDWSNYLEEYSHTEQYENSKKYWADRIDEVRKYRFDYKYDPKTEFSGYDSIKMTLTPKETADFLRSVNNTMETEINDLLLSALAEAVYSVTGQDKITVTIENHGRERLHDEILLDRTIGWFTCMYPVVASRYDDIRSTILSNKQALNDVAENKIAYGIAYAGSVSHMSEIEFNYLGQLGGNAASDDSDSNEFDRGIEIAEENEFSGGISVNGSIMGGILGFSFSYDRSKYAADDIQKMVSSFKQALLNITECCLTIRNEETLRVDVTLEKIDVLVNSETFKNADEFLCDAINKYKDNISGSIAEKTYLATVMQNVFFKEKAQLNCVTYIDVSEEASIDDVLSTIKELVRENSIFRSTYDSESHMITEYPYNENWNIPYFEEDEYSVLMDHSYISSHNLGILTSGGLQSYIMIVGKKFGGYRVMFFVHHGLWDKSSALILKNKFTKMITVNTKIVPLYYSDYVAEVTKKKTENHEVASFVELFMNSLKTMTDLIKSRYEKRYVAIVDMIVEDGVVDRFKMDPIGNIMKFYRRANPIVDELEYIPFAILYHGRPDVNDDQLGLKLVYLPCLLSVSDNKIIGGLDLISNDGTVPYELYDMKLDDYYSGDNFFIEMNYHGFFEGEINNQPIYSRDKTFVTETNQILKEIECNDSKNNIYISMPMYENNTDEAQKKADEIFNYMKKNI